jgi:2-amino-4-hydroxy-6-hydroxymethyldihydropteridine diphosphokinase/dihydropteroate synthase
MVILGIGSNLGDKLTNLRRALKQLNKTSKLSILKVAPIYESDALIPENAPKDWNKSFLNTAIKCQTTLTPEQLLDEIKRVEKTIGRPATYKRWSPRLIDIDILAWDQLVIDTDNLKIPQANLTARPFALWPLADLEPNWIYCTPKDSQCGKTVQEIVNNWGSRFDGNAPFHTKQIQHRIDCAEIVGIINVTPDSFSDGGLYNKAESALQQAQSLFAAGASILDIGAESTRPGSKQITATEEWERLAPILQELSSCWSNDSFKPKISIDTRHELVANKSIELGADWINDVTGFSKSEMRDAVRDKNVKLVFMHSLSIPPSQNKVLPSDKDPVDYLLSWAKKRIDELINDGIKPDQLIFDPGIGFGKTATQSFAILQRAAEFKQLNIPCLIGHSRKSFLNLFTAALFAERDLETTICAEYLDNIGIDYIRVHNVKMVMDALRIRKALD